MRATTEDPNAALWQRDLPSLARLCLGIATPNRKITKHGKSLSPLETSSPWVGCLRAVRARCRNTLLGLAPAPPSVRWRSPLGFWHASKAVAPGMGSGVAVAPFVNCVHTTAEALTQCVSGKTCLMWSACARKTAFLACNTRQLGGVSVSCADICGSSEGRTCAVRVLLCPLPPPHGFRKPVLAEEFLPAPGNWPH